MSRLAALLCATALGGCASLLPTAKDEVVSAWNSYDDAVKSLAAITPYQATRADAHRQGLDPAGNSAVKILHFGDVLQRFAAAALLPAADVDRGIRDCLHAGQKCTAYTVSVKKLTRTRVGSFWLDSLNFRRETVTRGWSAEVLLVFVDDLLVYELIGGQPSISDYELRRNPLGPLQGWGEYAVPALR